MGIKQMGTHVAKVVLRRLVERVRRAEVVFRELEEESEQTKDGIEHLDVKLLLECLDLGAVRLEELVLELLVRFVGENGRVLGNVVDLDLRLDGRSLVRLFRRAKTEVTSCIEVARMFKLHLSGLL